MKERLEQGEVLAGKYRVEQVLGRGGMGVVIEATHLHLRQRVAIKFLTCARTPEHCKRFAREARAAASLQSEHVAKVIDVGELEPGGAPFIVMEYLEGTDLAQELKRRGNFLVQEATEHLLQVCEALAEAHAKGIIHRDLKPGNLFLSRRPDGLGIVKVLDFGIAKIIDNDPSEAETQLTRTTDHLGTTSYMSPEQVKDAHEVDERSDIWALGVILYQLVTGQLPFKGASSSILRVKIREENPDPPSTIRQDLPPQLENVILRCLEKKPGSRYGTVAELAAAIAPFAPRQQRGAVKRIVATLANARRGTVGVTSPVPGPRPTALTPGESTDTAARSALSKTLAASQTRNGRWVALAVAGLAMAAFVGWDVMGPEKSTAHSREIEGPTVAPGATAPASAKAADPPDRSAPTVKLDPLPASALVAEPTAAKVASAAPSALPRSPLRTRTAPPEKPRPRAVEPPKEPENNSLGDYQYK